MTSIGFIPKKLKYILFLIIIFLFQCTQKKDISPFPKANGYHGIWFTLGQFSEFGDKYSGGLGTYTAKHRPLAIYSKEAHKSYFTWGGTIPGQKRLLIMVSYYDHATGMVPKPTIVHDKQGVKDPHDNASIALDEQGYIWIFVSGRARKRPGFKYRSTNPHSIDAFELVTEEEMAYPQPVWINGKGFIHLFTKYTAGRELYWETSTDGIHWRDDQKLAGMGGHYQITEARGSRVITAFSWHPQGDVDRRTNLYFVQTKDLGESWQNVTDETMQTPLTDVNGSALVRDYHAEKRLVYLKDIQFDSDGQPVILYVTSRFHQPGPQGDPRIWTIAHWNHKQWQFHEVTQSTHNYDMGSLYIEARDLWRIIAPTEPGAQRLGTGGEIAIWESYDRGQSWLKTRQVTANSPRNHGYVRRPIAAHPDFYAFWADGNPDQFSVSHLYFCNRTGEQVFMLPVRMDADSMQPERK